MLSLWLLWWLSKPFFVWYRLKVRNNWLFVTNLLPRDKTKPPGKSFLFPKQFDHRPHVHLCVLSHNVQDLFWWAVDVEGFFNIVWTFFGGVLRDISILIGPILVGCWWLFQCCLDFDIDQMLFWSIWWLRRWRYWEEKNYFAIISHGSQLEES